MSNVHTAKYQRFLQKLRQARVEAGLTQVQVAKKCRKPQSFVAKFESGERRLDFVEVEKLAKLYGKPITFFRS